MEFAYCYRLFLSWNTRAQTQIPILALLDNASLANIAAPMRIHVLETSADASRIATMVSLLPSESVSTCASKLKGCVSKWLRTSLNQEEPLHLLSRGYFAKTTGKSNTYEVQRYLETQPSHHGYANRILPPVYVRSYALDAADLKRLNVAHAVVTAQFHVVVATLKRIGFFSSNLGEAICSVWLEQQNSLRFAVRKVSVVPDHIHLALQLHPTVSPAVLVAELMNVAQSALQDWLVAAGLPRLWQPSAYIGSFGDLTSPQIRKYINKLGAQ